MADHKSYQSSPESVANPGPAYSMQRADMHSNGLDSLEYSSAVDSESYIGVRTLGESSVTGHAANFRTYADATETVHEMHLALLYLLSNPEEFQKALGSHPARGATTLEEWNAEYDTESMTEVESVLTSGPVSTPLPFVVFADDAEVVLPQAHTASQLFGLERLDGIELEAAAGIPSIAQLFLRWLALMPGGDHLNIIDPPGLTVMRIAGGRYRVTAAHRVVWTWMNEFAPLTTPSSNDSSASRDESVDRLQVGDLVTMTIVDVFETDNQGKLLSYCPTFDNRAIHKTHATAETLRKSSNRVISALQKAQKSKLARLVMNQAQSVAKSVRQKVDEAVHTYQKTSPPRTGQVSIPDEHGDDPEEHEV